MRSAILLALLPLAFAQYGGSYGAATTAVTSAAAAAATASTSTGSSPVIVKVGKDGLTFTPNSITAAVGTKIQFNFYPQNHSVVQSSFAAPCVPLAGGAFSGFMPVTSGLGPSSFTMTVANTKPIWLYCSQAKHCETGMSMVINQAATGANTLVAYQAAAKAVAKSGSPAAVAGGVVGPSSGGSSSAGSGSGTASGAAATGAGSTATAAGGSTATTTTTPIPSSAAAPGGVSRVGWSVLGAMLFAAGMV
jgi:plastocyanin